MLILAHRGAHERVRENTLDAFTAAGDAGADGVELDARVTADGAVVVHHDATLPDGRAIERLTVADLPPWVPTLDAALEACRGLRLVNVEIKAGARAVAAAVAGRDRVVLSSFDLGALAAARERRRSPPTGWLTLPGYDPDAAIASVVEGGHSAVHPADAAVDAGVVAAAHRAGLAVAVWTVNDPARMEQLAGWGVDVMITDRPALAASVLH